jgi:hypothetical protein
MGWINKPKPTALAKSCTDVNWGQQDASYVQDDVKELIDMTSVWSLLVHVIIQRGGPSPGDVSANPKHPEVPTRQRSTAWTRVAKPLKDSTTLHYVGSPNARHC